MGLINGGGSRNRKSPPVAPKLDNMEAWMKAAAAALDLQIDRDQEPTLIFSPRI